MKRQFTLFKFSLIIFCVCAYAGMYMHTGTREGQKTTCRNGSPSTMCVLRTELQGNHFNLLSQLANTEILTAHHVRSNAASPAPFALSSM